MRTSIISEISIFPFLPFFSTFFSFLPFELEHPLINKSHIFNMPLNLYLKTLNILLSRQLKILIKTHTFGQLKIAILYIPKAFLEVSSCLYLLPECYRNQILVSLFIFMHWRRKWQPTPVFLPVESQGEPGGLPSMGSHRFGHD